MSNYQGRKPEFTPAVYTRYFERSETPKGNGHIYFTDNNPETTSDYQVKRDLIFKRLFPSKYANSNNSEIEQINSNSSNNAIQPLGDFISLSNNQSSVVERRQSPAAREADFVLSSSDENEEDLFVEARLPSSRHESIVGHLHSRSTIESVRSILIRELYDRTSDPHTEWLKCKMNISKEFINPKYYSDFQRRYKNDFKKNISKKKKSISIKEKTENGFYVYDLTTNDESTTQMNNTLDNDIFSTSSTKPFQNNLSSTILLPNDTPNQSISIPELITLDSDEDDNINQNITSKQTSNSFFIDRSSTSFTAIPQPSSKSTEDYHKEDSKYAQLPSRPTSSTIRPILSKKQRRKQNNPTTTPLVSAIDRIIDQMDQSDSIETPKVVEEKNLLLKQLKKRKKKKKKKLLVSSIE